jgi:selenocysteine lyase/cysteine desulfurase
MALGLAREELVSVSGRKEHPANEQEKLLIADRKQGAVRISPGLATNFSDVYHFLQFAHSYAR